MGKLFVLEGTDGSGKSTQFRLLCAALEARGRAFRRVTFPRYDQDSSMLLRMYLRGDFGAHPGDVNPYAASTFFAVDRYASFKTDWGADYARGVPVFCDRYTTSNAVHQASKLPESEAAAFCDWLFHYEYDLLGLPRPTGVIFLDMPSELSFALLRARQGASGDIHERDHAYLAECRRRALLLCERCGWKRVSCGENGRVRTEEEIHRDVLAAVEELL